MLLVKEDITERRRAEEALRESERWLRESQRISQTGTYVLDVTSGIFSTSWMSQTSLNTATTSFTQKGTPESAARAWDAIALGRSRGYIAGRSRSQNGIV